MKKIITTFLLLIILVSASFIYLKTAAQENKNNFFNDNLRYRFARYPLLRNILGLHYDGDAKYDYLGPETKNITIRIIPMEGMSVSDETVKVFFQNVQVITGKTAKYVNYPPIAFHSTSNLPDLRKQLIENNYSSPDQEAVIYLIIAGQKENDTDQLGSTLQENGIVVFQNTLMDHMRMDTPQNVEKYEAALMLHEFGHQIGLDHNPIPGCLMNEQTEFMDIGRIAEMKNDFCDVEKEQIRNMKF